MWPIKKRLRERLLYKLLQSCVSFVSGAPGRPIIYEPSSRNLDESSFTLKWKGPEDTGGDSDIVYKIRYRDESDPDRPGPWNNEETRELEVDIEDLDKSKRYKFEVRATNKGGESEPAEKYYWRTSKEGMNAILIAQFIVIVYRLSSDTFKTHRMNFRLAEKFERTLRTQGTVQFFRSVRTNSERLGV